MLKVQDILVPDKIATIPLSPSEVRGSINLRGRIVTVIDVRARLGLEARDSADAGMGVTVELQNELYTLLVDSVGDVIGISQEFYESNPGTLGFRLARIRSRRLSPGKAADGRPRRRPPARHQDQLTDEVIGVVRHFR